MNATDVQMVNLQREIQRRKEDARQCLISAFWYTRTRSELEGYTDPAATPEYTLGLPEFQEFVRELATPDAA